MGVSLVVQKKCPRCQENIVVSPAANDEHSEVTPTFQWAPHHWQNIDVETGCGCFQVMIQVTAANEPTHTSHPLLLLLFSLLLLLLIKYVLVRVMLALAITLHCRGILHNQSHKCASFQTSTREVIHCSKHKICAKYTICANYKNGNNAHTQLTWRQLWFWFATNHCIFIMQTQNSDQVYNAFGPASCFMVLIMH